MPDKWLTSLGKRLAERLMYLNAEVVLGRYIRSHMYSYRISVCWILEDTVDPDGVPYISASLPDVTLSRDSLIAPLLDPKYYKERWDKTCRWRQAGIRFCSLHLASAL